MPWRISFKFNFEKFLASMTLMAQEVPDLTSFRASKLFYFADKFHLTRYGRPIMGDMYVRMDHGPVPSHAYDLMNEIANPMRIQGLRQSNLGMLRQYLRLQKDGPHPVFEAKKKPNTAALSESDIEALNFAIENYGHLTVSGLWLKAHAERAWKETDGHWIDYRLFFDEQDSDQMAVLEFVEEQGENATILKALTEQR